MSSDVRYLLEHRYVLFSCEGAAEGVVIQRLFDDGLLAVSKDRVVFDSVYVDRPYTRTRKAEAIADHYLTMDYTADGAEGILIARIVDSRAPRFDLPRWARNGVEVRSFYTSPEIEMLAIHRQGAYEEWLRQSRRDRSLRPNEFCKRELGLSRIKETAFLEEYWSDGRLLVEAIREYASKSQREDGDLFLANLLG